MQFRNLSAGKGDDRSAARHDGPMTDEFMSLKIAIVSDAVPERTLMRQAASQAPVLITVTEIEAASGVATASEWLARGSFDVVFFDSRIPKLGRQELLDAIRATPGRPLAVLIGAAAMKTREVLTEGLEVDGALAKPIDKQETIGLIERCVRARLPKRVLVVDDSSTVRAVVRKVLQASRFQLDVAEANDGAAAIAAAKAQRFDFVFLDCQMPGLDGFAVLAEFRTAHPAMKVVMITGTRDVRIEDRARAEGATDFLYKPFFAKDIDAVLNRLLGLMSPKWN
jgi:CheY-like chemotaxis protein